MSQKIVHGYAWIAYPDALGLDPDEISDPGHPFEARPGELRTPEEVLYYRRVDPKDSGVVNPPHAHSYLVMTKMQHHPRLAGGWESDPATLTDKFKSADGKVKMSRMVHVHHRHAGDLMECELSVEVEAATAAARG